MTDAVGNPTFSTDLNAATAVGGAFRRFLQSGVFNGDFALTPYAPSGAITVDNPLPYWTFVQASGTAISAASVADAATASGRVLQLTMAAGAAGDDAYIEQIVAINGSAAQNWYHMPFVTFKRTGSASVECYGFAQFLKADGTTTTGSSYSFAFTNITVYQEISLHPNAGIQPTDAYYLLVRAGLRRAGAATSATAVATFPEVVVRSGHVDYPIADSFAGKSFGLIRESGGSLFLYADYASANSGAIELVSGASSVLKLTDAALSLAAEQTTQILTAAGDTINAAGHSLIFLTSTGGSLTMTSAPTVSDGVIGQVLILVNIDSTDTITLQDQGTLANSNLRLSTTTFAMGPRDSITFVWAALSYFDWVEIARSNVL